MIRVVLDTNVAVSALLKPTGNEAAVLLLALSGALELCVSDAILTEYEEVLRRPRLHLARQNVSQILESIRATAEIVDPVDRIAISEARCHG